ncbi:ribosome maturation factor RimP [Corynebacterium lubricantis]|uniref:ribosome maturation factor RimP n=1 Tax=Corynebacterium lubricantis TaxID=541095 RepID=UPI00035DA62D|nr:ribosome maturation factor RimP [Corynebacterium lubricantis]
MAFPTVEELTTLIAPVAERHSMDIERVGATRAGKKSVVSIALDSETRPTLDELEVVSNEIGEEFDAAEERGEANFGAGYSLEVTTPGVDHPLTLPRHWRRNRARIVALFDEDGQKTFWRIGALNADETEVVLIAHDPKANKSQADPAVKSLVVSESPRAVVEIEFSNPPAAELALAEKEFDEALNR